MPRTNTKLHITLLLLLLGLVISVPSFAGSAVIGSVAGSMNATMGGQALLPNSTVFSGDSLQVKDGAAVLAVAGGSRIVLGRETVASFLREANEVTVLLGQGNVSVFCPDGSVGLRVKAGDISIVPGKGFKTLGEVAMLNGALLVTAKEGSFRVEGNGPAVELAKGKTITILTKTARAPQGGAAAGGAARISTSTALQIASVAAGGVSAVLSGIAISRANDAKTAAKQADLDAIAAKASADAATSAAAVADSDAIAAGALANLVGCALNNVSVAGGITTASPYTPPSGAAPCPPTVM